MVDLPDLLTLRQASMILNVHPNTLRNWERDGVISAIRIGSRKDRRFLKSVVAAIVNGETSVHA